ncbi:dynamin family protein [Helicobacter sp. T3_23-1056]
MSALQKCPNCGIEAELFCYKCGEIVGGKEFSDKNSLEQSSKNLKDFIAKLSQKVESKPAPNTAVQSYFDEVAKIKNVLLVGKKDEDSTESKKILDGFINEAENFLNQSQYLEIAFVGTINAGKSTLINALLKAEYASTHSTPETATLTKFRYGEKAEMKITFYTKNEWEELWNDAIKSGKLFKDRYDELGAESYKDSFVGKQTITEDFSIDTLRKYTSSKSPQHFFIKEVEISYPDFPYQKNLMFVDTPGLDDPVPYRSNITRDYISTAKVVLVCNMVNSMKEGELNVIYSAFDNTGGKPEKVYVLGTQYDTFSNPKQDWDTQKAEWANYLTSPKQVDGAKEHTCYTKKLANKNIIGVSGWTAFLCELYKKGELKDTKPLKDICYKIFSNDDIDANLDKLLEFSNVDLVNTRIQKDILDNAQKIYIDGVKATYHNLQRNISEYFTGDINKKQETYNALSGGLEATNAQISKEKDELKELQKAQNEMENIIADFESQSKAMLENLGEQIQNLIESNK